jgi:hypothetical protein
MIQEVNSVWIITLLIVEIPACKDITFVFLETFAVQLLIPQMENLQLEVTQNQKQVYVPSR